MSKPILSVKDLKKYFKTKKGILHAVDGLNFEIEEGRTLGMVGESGCGKSTCGRAILRLHEPTSGSIIFDGKDIVKLSNKQMREIRKDMQMIFQDPFASLNPRRTVSEIIAEPLKIHGVYKNKIDLDHRVEELMETVGLANRLVNTYPHELDGGRRQRIGIARALALDPRFVVCDEPVSSLDVSIQAQVLNLLKELQNNLKLTYIFITHDLSVVHYFADDILVMYMGTMVEKSESSELFKNPLHPYTKALLSAIPVPDIHRKRDRVILSGEVSSPIDPKPGCRFAPRCQYVKDECFAKTPEYKEAEPNHFVACHLFH